MIQYNYKHIFTVHPNLMTTIVLFQYPT